MTDRSLHALRQANLRRNELWNPNGLAGWSLSDWMTATCGELGEAANVIKKLNRVRDGMVGNREDAEHLRAALAKELADTAIYMDLLAAAAGVDLAAAIVAKFNEVSDRHGFDIHLPQASPRLATGDSRARTNA